MQINSSRNAVRAPTGVPLQSDIRRSLGNAFAQDLSSIQIHYDPAANARAVRLGARAVTHGRDIFFATGQYAPDTQAGRRLLAHEIAHALQGRLGNGTAPASGDTERASTGAEAEARRAGALASFGLPVGRLTAPVTGPALTPTSDAVEPLLSYSFGDWAVTESEERKVVTLLTADPNLSLTVLDLARVGMLEALLDRVDEPAHRRDLMRLLGARLNPKARAIVEPIIQDVDVNTGETRAAQIQYNLGRLGVTGRAALFDPHAYADLAGDDALAPFSGVGATGVNPSKRGHSDWAGAGMRALDDNLNAVSDLSGYLSGLSPSQRRRQVESLVKRPISTTFQESYAGALPSRLQVMKALGVAHQVEPELIAAIILAEQRDQSRAEDARDFLAGMLRRNTSIGLGQVVGTTARKHDLFADLLTNEKTTYAATTGRGNVNPENTTWLLASDEVNIAATARYIRIVADQGAKASIAALPKTQAAFPGINLSLYGNHSSTWPEDNIGALGMYYTSRAWTDDVRSQGWGWFVQQAYRDVKSAGVF